MNTFTSLATAAALAAAGAPLVCQAQDPAAEFKNVQALRKAGKNADALARVEQVLKVYGNTKSRVAQQFMHMTPYFYWQKGEILSKMGEVDKACAAFEELANKPEFKDKNLIERSKSLPGQKEGYVPYLTAARFQIGNLRYQQAVGTKDKPGDPAMFEQAIPILEDYLKYYEGKATKTERDMGLDGKVCFLLMQSYLLKPQPDFAKAGIYIEKGKKAKTPLPDDMVMNGLNTVLAVALKNPQYIGWGEKMISANATSFHLTPDRMAQHAPVIFNFGVKAAKEIEAALRAGDMERVGDAMRTTYALFGLVPDTHETVEALTDVSRLVGGASGSIPDTPAGIVYEPARIKSLLENTYKKFETDHRELEGYITLTMANNANILGSPRLAKAGYKVLIDRHSALNQKKGDELVSMRDVNYLQYMQFARATGDEATALEYEKKIDGSKVGDDNMVAVVLNKMSRMVKEKRWQEALSAADEAMNLLSSKKESSNYVTSFFSKVAALYSLGRWQDVVKSGEELLASGLIKPGTAKDQLKESQAKEYESQTLFFIIDAAMKLGASDPSMYDKAMANVDTFIQKFPSLKLEENKMAPNVYYDAINVLIHRRGHGKAEAEKQDLERALRFCDTIAKNWPESELYPTSRLIAGNVIISGEDDSVKPEALLAFEECVESALKLPDGRGKSVAANALFLLAQYGKEYDREGEDKAAKAARIRGYFDRFWADADSEGNPYALQMASLQLGNAVSDKDVKAYDKALANAQKVIAREAAYGFHNNTQDPELEPTINSYVQNYVDGEKLLHEKELTLDEKSSHIRNFPGIIKEDKYTNAILQMALLTSMSEALTSARRAGDTDAAASLEQDIARTSRQMRDQFQPSDLTNFICVRMGNYEVDYARRLPAGRARDEEVSMALTYFDQVLSRNRDMRSEALLGKANALSLSEDSAKRKEAYDLYGKLTAVSDPDVKAPALIGLTDLNMSTKSYAAAVKSADEFMKVRSGNVTQSQRMDMQMKLAEAFCESGNVQQGLTTYLNIFNQNLGTIAYSAPACKAMMQQYWKRNNPSSGDRMKNNFKPSDHWLAWSQGQSYVDKIRRNKLEQKMSPSDRDKFNEVVVLLAEYAKDPKVQQEDKEGKSFQSQLKK